MHTQIAEIHVLIDDLNAENCTFGAICIQETWLNDNDDVSIYNLPGYHNHDTSRQGMLRSWWLDYISER